MVLVIGDINIDIIVNLRDEINFNTDSSSSIFFRGGGSAANFSFWFEHLGGNIRLISKTGDDFVSEYLNNEFVSKNIEFINIKNKNKQTGKIVILISAAGERTMFTDRDANLTFKPDDIKEEYFRGVKHLHIGAYSFFGSKNMEETARKTINIARENNINVSFDPSSYSGLKDYGVEKILNQTKDIDFCFPNYDEGKVLTKKEKPEDIVNYLSKYYKNVILKMGKKGCYITDKDKPLFIKQNKEVENADTTGAGDAFTAGFIIHYLENNDLKKAANYANETAHKCVKKIGGRP